MPPTTVDSRPADPADEAVRNPTDDELRRFTRRSHDVISGRQHASGACPVGWNEAAVENHLPKPRVGTHLLQPQPEAEWVTPWGTVASPLPGSHGMYPILAIALGLPDAEDR